MMDENYKFFQHKECEYFPCHNTVDLDKFNCLFCYCPLYLIEDCGGNNSFTKGIKVCTNCLVPHTDGGYEIIINKIIEKNKEKAGIR